MRLELTASVTELYCLDSNEISDGPYLWAFFLKIDGETVLLAAWSTVARHDAARIAGALDRSPIGLLRQYVRLFRSLVLFAEQELAPAP